MKRTWQGREHYAGWHNQPPSWHPSSLTLLFCRDWTWLQILKWRSCCLLKRRGFIWVILDLSCCCNSLLDAISVLSFTWCQPHSEWSINTPLALVRKGHGLISKHYFPFCPFLTSSSAVLVKGGLQVQWAGNRVGCASPALCQQHPESLARNSTFAVFFPFGGWAVLRGLKWGTQQGGTSIPG